MENKQEKQQNDFLSTVADMRAGAVLMDVNDKFNELMDAVRATSSKGEIQITLKIKPTKLAFGGSVAEVEIEHTVKTKKPELKVGTATFYVSEEGRLTRDTPGQEALFVEEAPKKEGVN